MMAWTNSRLADQGSLAGEPEPERGRPGVGRAHAKAILLGEHAVVYGAPALAIPVRQLTATAKATRAQCPGDGSDKVSVAITGPRPDTVTRLAADGLRRLVADFKEAAGVVGPMCVDVLIDCTIPQGRGLGSSAACARAAALAFADLFDRRLDDRAVFDLVQASEKVAHGRASGIDALATGSTSPILFRSGTARELPVPMPGNGIARPAEPSPGAAAGKPPFAFDGVFVIADSGASGSTKEAVEMVRRKFEHDPGKQVEFVRGVSTLTNAAVRDLARGRIGDFGTRLTENHRLLRDLGLSTERIDALVEAALAAGGLGAKISGGGLGGCMIALAAGPGRAQEMVDRFDAAGAARTWVVPVGRFAGHAD
jgi:mevalonate kinase